MWTLNDYCLFKGTLLGTLLPFGNTSQTAILLPNLIAPALQRHPSAKFASSFLLSTSRCVVTSLNWVRTHAQLSS